MSIPCTSTPTAKISSRGPGGTLPSERRSGATYAAAHSAAVTTPGARGPPAPGDPRPAAALPALPDPGARRRGPHSPGVDARRASEVDSHCSDISEMAASMDVPEDVD